MTFSYQEKTTIIDALNVFYMFQRRNPMFSMRISYEDTLKLLSSSGRVLIKRLFAADPREYGFRAPYLGDNSLKLKSELLVLKDQHYHYQGKKQIIPPQYVARHVYGQFRAMAMALRMDCDGRLLIRSGYRSSGRQLMNFLFHLKFHNFQFKRTVRHVAFPKYSEHAVFHHAIDLLVDNIPAESMAMVKTKEYKWLIKHAERFGFTLSYPQGNKSGVEFEPWHWKYYPLA